MGLTTEVQGPTEEPREVRTHSVYCVPAVRGREAFVAFLRDVATGLAHLAEDELGRPAGEERNPAAEWLGHDLLLIAEAAADALEGHEVELVPQDADPVDLAQLLRIECREGFDMSAEARMAISRRLGEVLAEAKEEREARETRSVKHPAALIGALRERLGEEGLVSLLTDFDAHDVRCLVSAFHAQEGESREDVRNALDGLAGGGQ